MRNTWHQILKRVGLWLLPVATKPGLAPTGVLWVNSADGLLWLDDAPVGGSPWVHQAVVQVDDELTLDASAANSYTVTRTDTTNLTFENFEVGAELAVGFIGGFAISGADPVHTLLWEGGTAPGASGEGHYVRFLKINATIIHCMAATSLDIEGGGGS